MNDSSANVILNNINKYYKIYTSPFQAFKKKCFFKKDVLALKSALSNVSFEVGQAEVVGLVGLNGAGKSTLLKILAGLIKPDSGVISVKGNVHAILNISTGLMDNLTGRENICHLSSLYGNRACIIENIEKEIIHFSGLSEFIEFPVGSYSTGMKARLAFSIVTSLEFDILLIDEALSVGDIGFVSKCRKRIMSLCSLGKTIFIVSHSLRSLKELCTRVIYLDQGRIVMDGNPAQVLDRYAQSRLRSDSNEMKYKNSLNNKRKKFSKIFFMEELSIVNKTNPMLEFLIPFGHDFSLMFKIQSIEDCLNFLLHAEFIRSDGVVVFSYKKHCDIFKSGESEYEIEFGEMRLGKSIYKVNIRFYSINNVLMASDSCCFSVCDENHSYNAAYHPKLKWGES